MRIVYLHSAEIGFQKIWDWGNFKFSAKEANRFVRKLMKEIDRLKGHPTLGNFAEDYEPGDFPLRYLVIHEFFKAEYFYDKDNDSIVVTHIIDTRQNPDFA